MTPLIRREICIIFCCLFIISTHLAVAQEAKLTNIIVTNTRDDLLLYLNVEGAFTEKIEKAILSGVPTTFSFFITLYKVQNFWFDKKIADQKITHTIAYNHLKKEFIINRSWENTKPTVALSLNEAKKYMVEIDSLKIVPLSKLEKGKQYQIRSKAELSKLTLPLYLHHILIFVSFWDFETDWYTIDFIY